MNTVDVIVALVRRGGASARIVPSLLRDTPGRTAAMALTAIVSDPNTPEEVHQQAASALVGTQDPEALPALAAVLVKPNTPEEVRRSASWALQRTQDQEALGVLVAALADPNTPEEVHQQAASALVDPHTPVEVRWVAAYALESAGPLTGVAQALLIGGNVLTDDLVRRVISNRLVPDVATPAEASPWPSRVESDNNGPMVFAR